MKVLRTIFNPTDEDAGAKLRVGKMRSRARMKGATTYLDTEHDYVLRVGEARPQAKKRRMTGRMAMAENNALEAKFIRELDANSQTASRLPRWCLDK